MGKITCANVVSDVYATGVTNIDSLTMILSICDQMTIQESDLIMPKIIEGFQAKAKEANVNLKIDCATYNPWCIIGGTATSVCLKSEYISPFNAEVGDVIVLSKPLGAQLACNLKRWSRNPDRWCNLSKHITLDEVELAFQSAMASMSRLNKNAAILMHKYHAHGATDITGFGILGHAQNLASTQKMDVNFVINTLPVIKNMYKMTEFTNTRNKFLSGFTPETSGGLLIILREEFAISFCNEIKELDNCESWIIGRVIEGEKTAKIDENPTIVEI